MTQLEYEQKKRECWEEFSRNIPAYDLLYCYRIFGIVFDRAYALGKQFGNSEQVDAEGVEMLTVPRKRVEKIFVGQMGVQKCTPLESIIHYEAAAKTELLYTLFGSKCLPDETKKGTKDDTKEPNVDSLSQNPTENCDNESHISADCNKPAEPKFTKGDMVHCKSFGYEGDYKVLEYTGGPRNCYDCIDKYGAYYRFYESDLEPYTGRPILVEKLTSLPKTISQFISRNRNIAIIVSRLLPWRCRGF